MNAEKMKEIKMNVSVYAVHVRQLSDWHDEDAAFRHYRNMGIVAADVLESELVDYSLEEYKSKLNRAGMDFGAFVATTDIITAEGVNLEENLTRVKGFIDELERLGVPKIMLAPNVRNAESPEEYYAMRERMVEGYQSMAEYARGSGVTVMIENQSVRQRADSLIEDCKYIIDNAPDVGFVLDAGNFFCVREDVLTAYEVFRDRIVHSHIKDWEYNEFGRIVRSYMPPLRSAVMGKGLLPLDTLITRMRDDGYSGSLLLEVNGRPFDTELLDKSAEYLLSFVR